MAGNLFWDKMVLGLHCDGTNGSTTFTDVKGKTVTANGNAQISTAQYPALTGKTSSGYFDGTGDYLSIPDSADWGFGSGDFTLRAHIRLAGYATNNAGEYQSSIVSQDIPTSRAFAFNVKGTSSSFTTMHFIGFSDNSTYTIVSGSYSFALNTWYLVEVCRVGNYVYLFVDGGLLNTGGTAFSRTLQDSSTTLKVGAEEYDATYKYYLNGYISEVEIYKGVGLHTASYTPSTDPFPDSSSAIIDKTGNAVTVTGTAGVLADASAFGGYSLQAYQSSGYVSIPVIDLTADKWTVECFINPDALPTTGYDMGIFGYGSGSSGVGGVAATVYSDGTVRAMFAHGINIVAGSISAGQRVHMFVMRDGDRIYIGSNGTVGESRLVSGTTFVGDKAFTIGYANATYLQTVAIKIDEWRVSANEAKYPTSGTYTIPAIAFPDP